MKSAMMVALPALLLMSGCDGLVVGAPATIVGNGVETKAVRPVEPFHEVEVSSLFETTIAIGPSPSVSLEVDDNLLPLVETYVEDGRLHVQHAAGSNIVANRPQKVAIAAPSLGRIVARGAAKVAASGLKGKSLGIRVSGASSVEVDGLECDSLELVADGAGRIKFTGKGQSLNVEASGGSRLAGAGASFESARVVMDGASRCETEVTGSISGDLSGAANLTVLGEPKARSVKTTRAAHVFY